jgi:hypothetical protein
VISALGSFELGVTRARAASAPGFRSVAVVGLGYVGLPTALALLESGIRVVGYDISESRLAAIKAHCVDLPDADQVRLTVCLETGRVMLTTEASALAGVEAVVVCVRLQWMSIWYRIWWRWRRPAPPRWRIAGPGRRSCWSSLLTWGAPAIWWCGPWTGQSGGRPGRVRRI